MDYTKYTQVAAQALSLAELFEARFAQGVAGPVPFRIELAAPDGPSTAGGKQALQHIKLVPLGGGPTIVIGSASTTPADGRDPHLRARGGALRAAVPRRADPPGRPGLPGADAGARRLLRSDAAPGLVLGARGRAGPALAAPGARPGYSVGSMMIGIVIGMVIVTAAYWVLFFRR